MNMEQGTVVARMSANAWTTFASVRTERYTQHLFLVLLGFLTVLVFLKVEIRLLLGADAQWSERIRPYAWLLHVHAICGSVALIAGAIQFFPLNRRKHPDAHRILGRSYVVAVAIAAPTAIWIAARHVEASEATAAVAQSVIWLYATTAAVLAVLNRNIVRHRLWMARSYALTFTFVMSRFLTEILQLRLPKEYGGAAALIWLVTIGVLLIADSITRWNKNGLFQIAQQPSTA
jgi:uncharacterized membrane protein